MKVALLGPYPLQWRSSLNPTALPGGVDAVVLALAHGLAQHRDLEVSVITAAPELSQPTLFAGEGYRVYGVPHPRGSRLSGQRQVLSNLRGQIAALAPDIAHAHSAGIYGRAALGSGRPALVTLHGIIYREMQQAWASSSWPVRLRWLADALLEREVVRQARDIIAISPYVLTAVRGRQNAQFHLIENPVDDRFFAEVPPPPGADRVLCVARVIPRKGILALIEAFATMQRVRPQTTLVVAGETDSHPGYVAQCQERARELGVGGAVTFAGALPLAAVHAHCAACDIFVLASEQETAPVSIAEAMAVGRAVVATDVGGCRGMVTDGVTGRIVPPKEPEALAFAALELLNDHFVCVAMGQAARQTAQERFALGSVVNATVDLYQTILERGGRGQGRSHRIAPTRGGNVS